MKSLLPLVLLAGCATSSDLKKVETNLSNLERKSDRTIYFLQVETCRTDAIICAIVASANRGQSGEDCAQRLELCFAQALGEYRATYGNDPDPLSIEPKRAR